MPHDTTLRGIDMSVFPDGALASAYMFSWLTTSAYEFGCSSSISLAKSRAITPAAGQQQGSSACGECEHAQLVVIDDILGKAASLRCTSLRARGWPLAFAVTEP